MFRVVILTISDSSFYQSAKDFSGPALEEMLHQHGEYQVVSREILPDEQEIIFNRLCELSDESKADLILTTGGTGFAPRDVTPEATWEAVDKYVPGIGEEMRRFSLTKTKRACLSRGIAGIRKNTLIINLPGSPKAATENFSAVIDPIIHGIKLLKNSASDCAQMEKYR